MAMSATMTPTTSVAVNCSNHIMEIAVFVIIMLVLRVELTRRSGEQGLFPDIRGCISSCKTMFYNCSTEVAGIVCLLVLAGLFRVRGDGGSDAVSQSDAWEQIKSEWPLLMTADTLLSLQSMLRVIIFASVAFRRRSGAVGVLADEVASLQFASNTVRVLVLIKSRNYTLDGPIGGNLPAFCDALALPVLGSLCKFRTLRRNALIFTSTVGGVAWLASHHYLNLAGDDHVADQLFIAAHLFELLAACMYLLRTLLITESEMVSNSAMGLSHILLVVQQSLPAYYFMHAFEPSSALVGGGAPFEILQVGSVAQLAFYSAAAVLYIAEQHLCLCDKATIAIRIGDGANSDQSVVSSGTGRLRSIVL